MPWLFGIAGATFLLAGIRGRSADLLDLLEGDFQGENNFVFWFLSIVALGSLGYVGALRGLSRAMLALVLIVLVLAEDKKTGGGFFTEFEKAVGEITGSSIPQSGGA